MAQHTPTPLSPSTVDLVSALGHDLNNLLGIILGGLSLLREDLPRDSLDPELKAVLDDMLSAAQDASALIERLTTATGRQIVEAGAVDLNSAVTRFAEQLRARLPHGIRLEVQCADRSPMAWVDPAKLDDCLVELVDNAVTAMGGNGLLRLVCSAAPEPRLEVWDDGPGMDAALLERCARPYVTTWRQRGHRGLGLSLVQGFLQGSDARLSIESGPGQGTRVGMAFSPAREPASAGQ